MGGVLLAHQPTGEQGEPGLHEEHQVPRVEGPAEVGGDPHVPDGVGQLDRQRLFGCLVLVLVEGFFLLRVVRICLVGGLGDNKGIPGRVDGSGLVARGNAGGIRLELVRSERDDRRAAQQDARKENGDGCPKQHSPHQGRPDQTP